MTMNRNITINKEVFSEDINRFEEKVNKVTECLERISNNIGNVDGSNELWKSDTAVAMHEDYLELEKKFRKINVELNTYVIFLKETLERYEEEENKIDQAIIDNNGNLSINE